MDKAHEQTDKEIEILLKQIDKIYQLNEAECNQNLQDYLDSVKPKIDKYYKQYLDAQKAGVDITKAKDAYIAELKSVTIESQGYIDAVKKTAQKHTMLNVKTIVIANAVLAKVYSINYNQAVKRAEKALKNSTISVRFDLVDESTVKRLAKTKKILLPTKKVNQKKSNSWNVKYINRELTQGILKGESVPDIASRLQSVSNMNRDSAERNARTMCTSAENAGRQDHIEEMNKAGVHVMKTWMATEDERTRAWHSDLDGVTVEYNEPFHNEYGDIMYPGDPDADPANVYNCRCTMVEEYKKV